MTVGTDDLEAFGYYEDKLADLIKAVEDGNLDSDAIWNGLGNDETNKIDSNAIHIMPAYEGSIDAAAAFFESMLPLHRGVFYTDGTAFVMSPRLSMSSLGLYESACIEGNVARSLLLATLKMMKKEENRADVYRM